jgi:hypothetical protein
MSALAPLPRDPRLSQRAAFPHWLTERVRWSDTDLVGHVNNLSFGTYIETGRTEFLRELIDRNADSRVLLLLTMVAISLVDAAGAFGQLAHFVGDHGEAATGFTGPCGFDRGVERQQIGLFRDLLDDTDNA